MAWPQDPLEPEVGLYLGGQWVDATSTANGVRLQQPITITNGRSNWSRVADPARASFLLDNRDGRWSPDNPTGPYYGQLKRNIPCRIGVNRGEVHLRHRGSAPVEMVSTPDNAALDITGNISFRMELELEKDPVDIALGGVKFRMVHRNAGADGFEIEFYTALDAPVVNFTWFDSGGAAHNYTTEQTGAILDRQFYHEHRAIRADLVAATGVLTWYTSTTVDGTWTQLGLPCSGVGATSVKVSTAPLRVGGNPADAAHVPFPGKIYAFQLRNESDTIVADARFNTRAAGDTTWTDSAGRVWTVQAGGQISNVWWRFHGELASIPTRWSQIGHDSWVPVEATGIFRRLQQGAPKLESALRRGLLARSNQAFGSSLVAYWPMEETGDSLSLFGPAIGTAPLLVETGGPPNTGNYKGFACSSPLPALDDATLVATIPSYTPVEDAWQVRWLQFIPSAFTGDFLYYMRVETSDIVWEVEYRDDSGGELRLHGYRGVSEVYNSGYIGFAATGKAWRMTLSVKQNGANLDVTLLGQPVGGVSAGITDLAAVAGDAGVVQRIRINKDANVPTWAFGHVTLQSAETDSDELATELNAYVGERAATRIQRLCREEGIATRIEGWPTDTEPMGPQIPDTLPNLLRSCAQTDLGILAESVETPAVWYRTRASMIGQPVIIDLDYSAGEVANPLELDRDDAEFANDIAVKNWTGAEARAVLDDGSPSSVSEPPIGSGRYQDSFTVNCSSDTRLVPIALALLNLSAVDEPRVSRLSVALHHAALVADIALTSAIFDAALGDLIQVSNNFPNALGTTVIRQLMQGQREVIGNFEHKIDYLTSPASPWDDLLTGGDFPELLSRTESATNTPGTSHTVSFPGTTAEGDTLLAYLMFNADTTVTGPGGGWVKLRGDANGPGQSEVWGKIATGSDGASAVWTTSTSQAGAFQVLRIGGTTGGLVAGTDYTIASGISATTASHDPPNVAAGWGSANNLFIGSSHYRGGNQIVTAYPANYSSGDYTVTTNGGGGGAGVVTAVRQLVSGSDDPSNFTMAAAEYGRSYTIVLRGGDFAAPDSIAPPSIPAWDGTGAVQLNVAGADIAAAVAAQPPGTKFQLYNLTYTNAQNIRYKAGMRFQGPASGVAEFDGTSKGYCFRAIDATGSSDGAMWTGPVGSIKIKNYGNGTSRAQFGAITAQPNDVLAGNFDEPGCANGLIVQGVVFERNSSNGLRQGDNGITYQCLSYGHTVTGMGNDRNVGGIVHSSEFSANGLDPDTGVGSNGANYKLTWHNGSDGRTTVTGVDRANATLYIANCTFNATFAGVTGDTEIGLWLDLECRDVQVWDITANNHPWSGLILEGVNGVLVKRGTIVNSDGYGNAFDEDFVAGALTIGESNNVEVDGLTITNSVRAVILRQSNRSGDWYNSNNGSFVNYSWPPTASPAGVRYWILHTQTPRPAVGSKTNMWLANITCRNMVLTNCDRVYLNEGTDTGGANAMVTHGSLPLELIHFFNNDYSGSANIISGGFYNRSNTPISLASWRALPYDRDQV